MPWYPRVYRAINTLLLSVLLPTQATNLGRTYGTILVDLERRRPIDLLPDREAATTRL